MSQIRTYMDIGHDGDGAILWMWVQSKMFTWPRSLGSHEAQYGSDAMNHWRGRFDGKNLSVMPPTRLLGKYRALPAALRDALESEFSGFDAYEFNPSLRRTWKAKR